MKEPKIPASAYLIAFVVPVIAALILALVWLAFKLIPWWIVAAGLGYCAYKIWKAW